MHTSIKLLERWQEINNSNKGRGRIFPRPLLLDISDTSEFSLTVNNGRKRHARGRINIRCMGQVDLNQRKPGKHVGSRQSLPLQGLLLRHRNRAVLPYDAVLRSGGGAVPFGGCISFHWAGCAGRQYVGVLP